MPTRYRSSCALPVGAARRPRAGPRTTIWAPAHSPPAAAIRMRGDCAAAGGRASGRTFSDSSATQICSAHNPYDEFGNNEEVLCNWCGVEFKALVDEEGVLRLKET